MKNFKKNKYRILSLIAKYSFVVIILFTLVLPTAFAVKDSVIPPGTSKDSVIPPGSDLDKKSTSKTQIDVGIVNPLAKSGIDDIPSFIVAIINIVLYIGVPIITLAIIYSGFLFVQAQGNSEALKKAKQAFIYTLVGAAILLGSFVITKAIQGTVEQINTENV